MTRWFLLCVLGLVAVQGFTHTGIPGGLTVNKLAVRGCKDVPRRPQVALRAHSMQNLFDAASLMAADVSEAANTVDSSAVEPQFPAIEVLGQNFGGTVLLLVPVVGALIIFSILAWIITNTMFIPKDMFKNK
ncbi:hypothetical protein GUITHDRAFT_149925 [Guillardia theta CCMP2712]|uniref:Uncharacterized protein n=1 Tax=Guillardia theta (strain CCMP2712) TaxID=905079 RepID=L1K2Z6_GUITC|nr:hypothetical protein GUITHDRAFT_149925 [Guillardia theta CCMP2712]EKX54979.1 hypothetical protein GUITHDRAFT_149925 [Guillardia theta CCMP2712]|eukprot:XP_005841959.1 hypothetical protein GUITHDRAFT_149925 [Guillardia theta CCMP2712]